MNKHAEMVHIMLEGNLNSYANALWRFRSDNFPDKKTIEYLDKLSKEVQ